MKRASYCVGGYLKRALAVVRLLVVRSVTFTIIMVMAFYDVSPLLQWPPAPPAAPAAAAADEYAIEIESFDQDVTTNNSTFSLSNDVGNTNNAFIRMNTGTRKSSAGPTGSTGNTGPNVGTVGLVLTDTNEVTVKRVDSTAVKVMGEVWRYQGPAGGEHEFIVRDRVEVALSGSTASAVISGISNIDDTVPFITGYTVDDTSTGSWNAATVAAHIDDGGNLVVSRNNTGSAAIVYVDVVEFTGSAWTVCYGYSSAHDTAEQTITLNTDSDGQGGSTCDVGDWGTATIIEATMEGDSAETGLSDTLALVRPGGSTDSVVFDVQQDTNARNDGEAWIHVLQNDDMVVNRASNGNIDEGDGTYGTEAWPGGATTTAPLSVLGLEWFTDTSGVGNAHMRGGLHARIVEPTPISYNDGDTVPSTDYDSTKQGSFEAVLTFATSPEGVIYEAGGTGTGSMVGYNDSGNLVIRAGNGSSVTPSDAARIEITPSDYDFSSRSGTLTWEFRPDDESVVLNFDDGSNGSIDYATSTVAAAAWANWSGGDDGGVGTSNGNIAGSEIATAFNFNGTISYVDYTEDAGAGQIQHWIHRQGNNVGVEYGVIELSGLTFDNTFFGFDTLVTATSTHITTADIPSTDLYVGGTFSLQEGTATRNVTNLTVSEAGTIDGSAGISDIALYYDLDTTAPYDCASESYGGTESQFGSTDTNGFSGADGSASFSDSVQITTTQAMCVYPVLSITEAANDGETIVLQITDPSTDVVTTGGGSSGNPTTPQAISGSTTVQNAELTQTHYHWRNDDGSETAATSITNAEDTPTAGFEANTTRRLRLQVSNEGSVTAPEARFRLEYAEKVSTCAAATGWTDVESSVDWEMTGNSPNITDGDTTNITGTSTGEVTDENTTFVGTGALRESTSLSGSTTLATDEFIELEYAIEPTNTAPEGTSYCFRVTDNGTELRNYDVYAEGTVSADVTTSAQGSQTASLNAGATAAHIGGSFVLSRDAGNRDLTSVTITETGSINGQTNLDNIALYYDLDTSVPLDCASESYDGGETQLGATDTNGFSGPNGSSTFSGFTLATNNSQSVCLYVVLDVAASTTNGETIAIEITDPSVDVVIDNSTVGPSTAVALNGSTTVAGAILTQTGYHWRNDDDTEADATSATNGSENTPLLEVPRETPYRLRYQVNNDGSVSSLSTQYRLEYGTKLTTCEDVSSWQRIDNGAAFTMASTSQLVEGNDTIDVSSGGVSNPGGQTFLGTNSGQREETDTTSGVTLAATEFVELEYAIETTEQAGFSTSYCFRLTDAGDPLPVYSQYAELTTREKLDFFVQRGTQFVSGTGVTLTAGVDYTPPAATNTAFVRITNTNFTGAGHSVDGTQSPNNVTAYISDQSDLSSGFTISRPSSAGNTTRVSWELVEYTGLVDGDNQVVVRDTGTVTYGSSATVATGTAVNTVADDSDVVVFITGQSNPSADNNAYLQTLSTADWNSATNEPVFTRGQTGDAVDVSYAVVEFAGLNWKTQRVEHTYTAGGTTELQSITAVNSLSRSFIHAQKRVAGSATGLDDFGHIVSQSSIGSVAFRLNGGADTPSDHTSVAWVIENTQTGDGAMRVIRSSGSVDNDETIEPRITTVSLSPENLNNLGNVSLFGTNDSTGGGTAYPRPMLGLTATATDAFELFESDAGQTQTYNVMMMQWPVAQLAFEQNYYRLYVDNDTLTPTDAWPVGVSDLGENMSMTGADEPLGEGERVRIRMSVQINNASFPAETLNFKLQYGRRTGASCSAISTWTDVGAPGSGSIWRGFDASPTDGATLPSTLLSVSDQVGAYTEDNPSVANPSFTDIGEDIEYDWIVEHNGAAQRSDYCFRMVQSDDTTFVAYNNYPVVRTTGYTPVVSDWRWYDDVDSETPSVALAGENVSPVDIANEDTLSLRVNVAEVEGAAGSNVKFSLQYSEYPDFRDGGTTVAPLANCTPNSLWCYANGTGYADGDTISTALLNSSDTCSGGAGVGCGSHNEQATSASSVNHDALTTVEFSYALQQRGARANAVYYFRLVDVATEDTVSASSSYPNLVVEGAAATFGSDAVSSGTSTDGHIADIATTPSTIPFGVLPLQTEYTAIQRLTVDTNATEGYRVLIVADGQLTNAYGESIPAVTASNTSPSAWSSACSAAATGCFGYHSGDDTLSGDGLEPVRFAPDDTFAALSTTPEELFYSEVPGNFVHDIVYKLEVGELQSAGDYSTSINYIIVPVF